MERCYLLQLAINSTLISTRHKIIKEFHAKSVHQKTQHQQHNPYINHNNKYKTHATHSLSVLLQALLLVLLPLLPVLARPPLHLPPPRELWAEGAVFVHEDSGGSGAEAARGLGHVAVHDVEEVDADAGRVTVLLDLGNVALPALAVGEGPGEGGSEEEGGEEDVSQPESRGCEWGKA